MKMIQEKKNLFLDKEGKEFFEIVYSTQKKEFLML